MYGEKSSGDLTPEKRHIIMDALLAEHGLGEISGWQQVGWGADCYDRTSAHRIDLLNILTSLIPIESVQFNKRVKTIENTADKVTIIFTDTTNVTVAAVIDYDGIKGITRHYVLNYNP